MERVRLGSTLSMKERFLLPLLLAVPAMAAELSSIAMQYIDASMVGRLGREDAAAIGLVASSTWLLWGIGRAVAVGFSVQVGQAIGGGNMRLGRAAARQGFLVVGLVSLLVLAAGAALSPFLPGWLAGGGISRSFSAKASSYFLIYALAAPVIYTGALACDILHATGDMKRASLAGALRCLMDVIFNAVCIFPSREVSLFGAGFVLPGAGLGVAGAALGTVLAEALSALVFLRILFFKSELFAERGEGFSFSWEVMRRAAAISAPVAVDSVAMRGAYIAYAGIVAPLGTVAIAANSFAITAESICYMPGYGVSAAATVLAAQSIGAGRHGLAKSLSWVCTLIGMAFMSLFGVAMYFFAPGMMSVLSPDGAVIEAGAAVLRIEAFAEPLFAASIVITGALRGAGRTLAPSLVNFISMWCVRIPLAAFLVSEMGLEGAWTAMAAELCLRGLLMLSLLRRADFSSTGGRRRQLPARRSL